MKTFACFSVIGTIPIAIGFTELLAGVDKFLRQRISWILLVLTVTVLLHTTNQKKYKCVCETVSNFELKKTGMLDVRIMREKCAKIIFLKHFAHYFIPDRISYLLMYKQGIFRLREYVTDNYRRCRLGKTQAVKISTPSDSLLSLSPSHLSHPPLSPPSLPVSVRLRFSPLLPHPS